MKLNPVFFNDQCFLMLDTLPNDQSESFMNYIGGHQKETVEFYGQQIQNLVDYALYEHWFEYHYQQAELSF
jgi:hypothetical protein